MTYDSPRVLHFRGFPAEARSTRVHPVPENPLDEMPARPQDLAYVPRINNQWMDEIIK
jgi:hypothetical protein